MLVVDHRQHHDVIHMTSQVRTECPTFTLSPDSIRMLGDRDATPLLDKPEVPPAETWTPHKESAIATGLEERQGGPHLRKTRFNSSLAPTSLLG